MREADISVRAQHPEFGKPPLYSVESPAVIAHLSLLQGIVTRLAVNSASCKTWCITLVAALVSLAGATRAPLVVTVTIAPIVIFGFLDAMYLARERAYRALYAVIVAKVRGGTYGLSDVFEVTARISVSASFSALLSWSIWFVYGGLLATYITAHRLGWLLLLGRTVGAA